MKISEIIYLPSNINLHYQSLYGEDITKSIIETMEDIMQEDQEDWI